MVIALRTFGLKFNIYRAYAVYAQHRRLSSTTMH